MTESVSAGAPAGAKPAAVWEDFVDVFTGPSAVFARRRDGHYGAGVLLYWALSAIVFVATRPFWQAFFDRQFEAGLAASRASGKMSAEQLEQARGVAERFATFSIWVAGLAGPGVLVLLLALIILTASLVFGGRLKYGQAVVVATLAYVPQLIQGVAGAGILAVKDASTLAVNVLPTSPAALLGPGVSPYTTAILGRFDPFILWSTALIAIGVAVIGRVERAVGYRVAAAVWGFATLFALLGAARAVAAAG